MIDSKQLKQNVVKAVEEIRANNPMAGSITNTVTIDFVANAQLAVGGSAAMVYLPDEGEALVAGGGAIYLNQEPSWLIMQGGEISGNTATGNGGGVYIYGTRRRQALGARSGGPGHRQPAHPTGRRTQAVQTRHRARQCLRDYRARRPVGP